MLILFFFVGCTSDKDDLLLQTFTNKLDYHKELKQTEKVQLYENNITKAMLTATYLYTSNFENNDTRDEEFIVGVHLEDEAMSSIGKYGYSLTLNTQAPKKVEPLSQNDRRLKHISFVTDWGSYYLVTFPHVSKKSFNLIFESERYGNGVLHFAKLAKYALEEKIVKNVK
jgi:hypothetical protein